MNELVAVEQSEDLNGTLGIMYWNEAKAVFTNIVFLTFYYVYVIRFETWILVCTDSCPMCI